MVLDDGTKAHIVSDSADMQFSITVILQKFLTLNFLYNLTQSWTTCAYKIAV